MLLSRRQASPRLRGRWRGV